MTHIYHATSEDGHPIATGGGKEHQDNLHNFLSWGASIGFVNLGWGPCTLTHAQKWITARS